jgi:phage shock protein A
MLQSVKKWWKYLGAKSDQTFDERADPKVQLEQAIREAQDQHRRLREQAANVIANQKQAELRLNRAMGEYEKLTGNARQALIMADQASKTNDAAKATEYTQAAEAFANRLIAVERDVEDTKTLVLQSAQAADQAKAAVAQNSAVLQQRLAERQKLLGQLEQAKMQEQMNTAMEQLTATVGEDVPTFEQVREKIELRYAKAKGVQELTGQSTEGRMLEVEKAAMNTEAVARLDVLRAQMGLPVASPGGHEAAGLLEEARRLKAELPSETSSSAASASTPSAAPPSIGPDDEPA